MRRIPAQLARRVAAGELPEPDPAGELLTTLAKQNADVYARSAVEHAANRSAATTVKAAATTTTTPEPATAHESEEA